MIKPKISFSKLNFNKMSRVVTLCLFVFATVLTSCSKKEKEQQVIVNERFSQMVEDFYQDGLALDPLFATEIGEHSYDNLFPDYVSDEYLGKNKKYYIDYLAKANEFQEASLNEEEKTSKAVLQWLCESELREMTFHNEYFPIAQMWTKNLKLSQWANGTGAQPFKTVKDYENWLERLDGYLAWLVSSESKMRVGIASGYVLPKSLILKIIPQLEGMANGKTEDHLFYSPVHLMPATFTVEEKDKITQAYAEMVNNKIIPAYAKLHQFVSTDYLAAGRETSGISAIPNGEAFYAHRIRYNTATDMTADEVYQLGLDEVARIRKEMEIIKSEVGYSGDLVSFFEYLRSKKELMPFSEPQQVIDHFYAIYDQMKPQLKKLFKKTPRAGFEVRRTEAFRENSASAEYNVPSKDGSRPGIFYVPIPDAGTYNILSDEDLFLHEAIPGHHYQIALAMENKELPKFRQVLWLNAYGEGWALYTESLGKELGLYTDPYQNFGMLSAEMHRAIRLVVDAGMHSKGWTREQAIQYSLENEAETKNSIISEIERYMANPGQALGYKIGQLKIRELRTRAEKQLGNKFDIGAFHDQVLKGGCLPLSILESNINFWIKSQQL